MIRKQIVAMIVGVVISAVFYSDTLHAEDRPFASTLSALGQSLGFQVEDEYVKIKTMQLDAVTGVAYEFLRQKKYQKLKETATAVKAQRQTTQDSESFFRWMSTNLAGYNRYIRAGSYLAAAAKVLPIPYAGQVSNFTKFAGQFTVTLNKTSLATTRYMSSSQRFIAMVDAINPALR
jgi:hypothetical protein